MTETQGPRPDTAGVIVLPPLLYVGAFGLGLLAHFLFPRPLTDWDGRYWLGGFLLVVGLTISFWGSRSMVRAGTNVNPHEPSTSLVMNGPFQFSRNPLYVALNLVYLGLAVLINSMWMALLLIPVLLVMHFGVIRREERYLETKFGEPYRQYRSRVRRYL